uniref:C2H2-type domain-containing protein n=1 Tax=Kalanchoe fedtschenkoi TaxID=63787 RepID=A0A7N0VDU1_KALFE
MELPEHEATAVAAPVHQEPLTLSIDRGNRANRPSRVSSDEEERRICDSVVTEEEQDLANCLILLARAELVRGGKRKLADLGGCHECKACNKTFPSFQGLYGHRAGHGKPRSEINDCDAEKQLSTSLQLSTTNSRNGNVSSVKASALSNRVHQCSVCGSEFSSGQALGGHMRRHRAVPAPVRSPCTGVSSPATSMGEVKTLSVFSLDLNLPAPEESEIDHQRGLEDEQNAACFQQNTPVFSAHAHALLGCHH